MRENLDLQFRRKQAGLSQIDMAVYFDTSISTISAFELSQRKKKTLPGGQGREEYEAAIDLLARRAVAS